MSPLRHRTAALATAALITAALGVVSGLRDAQKPASTVPRTMPVRAAAAPERATAGDRHYRAFCRTEIKGSRATALCQNPYPVADRVSLHIECDRWWDIDADTAPVELMPAGYVQLTDRCWKEIRSAWISHDSVVP